MKLALKSYFRGSFDISFLLAILKGKNKEHKIEIRSPEDVSSCSVIIVVIYKDRFTQRLVNFSIKKKHEKCQPKIRSQFFQRDSFISVSIAFKNRMLLRTHGHWYDDLPREIPWQNHELMRGEKYVDELTSCSFYLSSLHDILYLHSRLFGFFFRINEESS